MPCDEEPKVRGPSARIRRSEFERLAVLLPLGAFQAPANSGSVARKGPLRMQGGFWIWWQGLIWQERGVLDGHFFVQIRAQLRPRGTVISEARVVATTVLAASWGSPPKRWVKMVEMAAAGMKALTTAIL